jgi:hypothetical protein
LVKEGGRQWNGGDPSAWVVLRGKDYYLKDITSLMQDDPRPARSRNHLVLSWTGTE